MHLKFKNVNRAYRYTVTMCMKYGQYVTSRNIASKELRCVGIKISHPSSKPIVTGDEKLDLKIRRYTDAEMKWYESQRREVDEIAKAAPFWATLADKTGRVNSNYGAIINHKTIGPIEPSNLDHIYPYTPWEWARLKLHQDRQTRQAILLFSQPHHYQHDTKDFVCTMHGQFFVRNGKLHFDIVMRSNDLIRGTVYDWPYFMSLQSKMAEEIGIPVGNYHHFVHSLHIYESDFKRAHTIINARETSNDGTGTQSND